jgi:pilus assembly protein Flp/PilA
MGSPPELCRMRALLRKARDDLGVTAIEYTLIAALISMVVFGATQSIGSSVSGFFQTLANSF